MHEHVLGGCAPTPLAHYLKALGILRLVAEQKDLLAAGRWHGEHFILRTILTQSELERFFLDEYRPTPIVAPWNGGSGFYPKDSKVGIQAILGAKTARFETFRLVVEEAHAAVQGLQESPKDEQKNILLTLLRSTLPDAALLWFDAAVMLTAERPGYPPLLGTGGNDGRLDFTNNFMQRLVEIIDPAKGAPTPHASEWLQGALYGDAISGLVSRAIGQFAPGSAGGPNASAGFAAEAYVNPWDFVMMLEGALLFAGAATRRLASADISGLSYPLTVRTTGSGSGSGSIVDEAPSRAEIWMPIWESFSVLAEIGRLFAEARVTLGRRAVRDGLDFSRAVCSYGADRGISAFQRFAFLMRSGKAYLATPLGRIKVRRDPKVDLLSQLDRDRWLDRLRSFARTENAPGRLRQLVRRLEDAIFALTQFGGRNELQRILVLLGQVQLVCAASAKGRDSVPPMPLLGEQWVRQADDQSHEFRIACALAGLIDMRHNLLPLKVEKGRLQWDVDSRQAVWAMGDLVSNLVRVLDRRLLEARQKHEGQREQPREKPLVGFSSVGFGSVATFLCKETDDARIAGLLVGLVNVKQPNALAGPDDDSSELPPADFQVLKPLFTPDSILRKLGCLQADDHLPLPREVVALLRSEDPAGIEQAINIAWRRLRIAGFQLPTHPRRPPASFTRPGSRLVAALMIPLASRDLGRLCRCLKSAQST